MVTLILIGLLSLPGQPSRDTLPPLRQGIEGVVYQVGGNRMPSPGSRRLPEARGHSDSLYIYELTNIGQVVRLSPGSPYYKAIHSRLIRSAATDTAGRFAIGLSPGRYSVFTKKGDLFFASKMDEKNNIAPVEVLPGTMTDLELRVESDHKPVY